MIINKTSHFSSTNGKGFMVNKVNGRQKIQFWQKYSLRRNRIKAALQNCAAEMKILQTRPASKDKQVIADIANQLVSDTIQTLQTTRKSLDKSWRHLHLAKRLQILLYEDSECSALALQLQEEASKLKKWREESVKKISSEVLDEQKVLKLEEKRKLLFAATTLRDEHYDNTYFKIATRKKYLWTVLSILLLAISGTITSLVFYDEAGADLSFLLTISTLGGLGAIFSIAYTATKSKLEAKIPDQMLGSFVAVLRTLIGIAAALALYVIMDGGFGIQMNGKELSNSKPFLALAFAAGFSERLIINAVNLIASEEKENKN